MEASRNMLPSPPIDDVPYLLVWNTKLLPNGRKSAVSVVKVIVPSLALSSPLFCECVPVSKWSGLTQCLFKHLCLTIRPTGISP